MPYTLPADVDERPVVIDGAGTLGRRIAAVYAGGGSGLTGAHRALGGSAALLRDRVRVGRSALRSAYRVYFAPRGRLSRMRNPKILPSDMLQNSGGSGKKNMR